MRPLTRSCFLLLLLGKLFLISLPQLLEICLPSPWNPPFPLHSLALIPLSLAKVWLSLTLTLSSLTIWYSGQTALFLFLLAKAASAYLPTALIVALQPLFPFQQAQFVQVFLLKPAPFCTLFAGFGSTNKSSISHLFSYRTLALSSPPCSLLHLSSYLKLSDRFGRNRFPSSYSIRVHWVPRHWFLTRYDAAEKLARQGALLASSTIPGSLSPLISHIHSSLFSGWRRTVSLKLFDTQVPSISTDEVCSLWSTLQRTQPSVKLLSL